jgi:uncharacterized membrane protein YfcA
MDLPVSLPVAMILVGLVAGVAGGMFGIGGGAIMVPALVLLLGLSQKLATGTSLGAQVLPVALLAAWTFHREGNLNIRFSLLLALGLVVGNLLGAMLANQPFVTDAAMKKAYGVFMLLMGARYLLDDTLKSLYQAAAK